MQSAQDMQLLLTAEQLGRALGVDRSTVYRMAEDGRLPAAKVGRQWRFRADEVARLLDLPTPLRPRTDPSPPALPPAAIVQPLLDVVAPLLGVMIVITDMTGRPVTAVANPCPWFAERIDDAELLATCTEEWRELADDLHLEPHWRTGALGFDCARAFIRRGPRLTGMVLAGGVASNDDDHPELYHLDAAHRARVLTNLPVIAAAVSRLAAATHPTQ